MNATVTARSTNERPRLGNYEPLLELASGGMATVYVARQLGAAGFERLVVIKRVHRHHLGNQEFYRMFLDEARVASLVRHPNVVSVIDTVEADGELFLVMEYVESSSLSALLKVVSQERSSIPAPIACRIMADTLAGLHAAHEATDLRGQPLEIVHRDVSPQNIIVGIDGASRLIDFGVAKASHRLTETRSGSLKGKLAYMSPEQAMGREVDRRVDLFAAGVALHEALTGRRLFQGENDLDTMRRITEMPVPDPSSIAPSVPRKLDLVVQRALMRDADQRFQSAAEFLAALEETVPLAPTREVGAYMVSKCRPKLDERRDRLRAIVDGTAAPLSLEMPPQQAGPSVEVTVAPGRLREVATEARSESSYSQISHIAASTRDASMPPPRQAPRPLALVGFFAAVGILAIGVFLFAQKQAPASQPVTKSETANATSSPTSKGNPDVIELRIRGDAPLASFRAPGSVRVQIEGSERDHGTLTVSPWSGLLPVEVTFEGGAVGHASVPVNGPYEIRVVSVAAHPPATVSPPIADAPSAPTDKTPEKKAVLPVRKRAEPPPRKPEPPRKVEQPSEMQPNPYH